MTAVEARVLVSEVLKMWIEVAIVLVVIGRACYGQGTSTVDPFAILDNELATSKMENLRPVDCGFQRKHSHFSMQAIRPSFGRASYSGWQRQRGRQYVRDPAAYGSTDAGCGRNRT